jgi:hypothetical protein
MSGLERALRRNNRFMVAFDIVLGGGALASPAGTLKVLGHDPPSPELEAMVRRQSVVWLTYAAAHLLAAIRDEPRDWYALAWLRGTEIATDALWARSPGFARPGARTALRLAGASNLAMAIGFGALARRGR